jgi:aldehyde dehydrogenase (NAD+)
MVETSTPKPANEAEGGGAPAKGDEPELDGPTGFRASTEEATATVAEPTVTEAPVSDPGVTETTVTEMGVAEAAFARVSRAFSEGVTRPAHWRIAQLQAIERLVVEKENELLDAMAADLGKPRVEAWETDLAPVAAWAAHSRRKLRSWMRPRRTWPGKANVPGSAWTEAEPRGTVLVISPWNYPVQLALSPLVAALSAGNAVVVKPSELTPATSSALARVIPQFLDNDAVVVVEGAADTATALLDQPFNHVFFTGSTSVGRTVAVAAAKQLASTTLELGGKSPAIVMKDADLEVAARRIAWGKLMNAGQTCVAPDYVLVERPAADQLVDALSRSMRKMEGPDPSATRTRIVNERHLRRLEGLLQDSGGSVVTGGEVDHEERWISPTVVLDPDPSSPLMQDEIFGPILPVVQVDSIDEAVRFVQQRPKPLSLYLFTRSRDAERAVVEGTSSGGICVNHVMMHLIVPELPFGGVGESGMGSYHGEAGFEQLSHMKPVLRRPFRPDIPIAYPPLDERKERLIRRLI